jgi:hypothetical protein
MGTEMASATDDDAIVGGEGATELMGNDVVGLYTFAERMFHVIFLKRLEELEGIEQADNLEKK